MKHFYVLLSACILLCSTATFSANAEIIGGGPVGWDSWSTEGEAWHKTQTMRKGNPYPDHLHMSSSEEGAGRLVSPVFTLTGSVIRFAVNGWDGQHGGFNRNYIALRLAEDDSIIRKSPPPLSDSFVTKTWLVENFVGKKVYIEALDRDTGKAFAWMGLAFVEMLDMAKTEKDSPFRAIKMPVGFGTWAVRTRDGANRETPPYLSSLAGGETGVGAIFSPSWKVTEPHLNIVVRGYDGREGGRNLNFIDLLDDEDGEILQRIYPPQSDFPSKITVETSRFSGRTVRLRIVDNNTEPLFAWIGVDEIDAGKDFRVKFSENHDLRGWKASDLETGYTLVEGIPFITQQQSILPADSSFSVPIGFKTKRLFLLGLTNSIDQGCPTWADPRAVDHRFFIGDRLGEIIVKYADGIHERYPLVLGESLWWGRRFYDFQSPFDTDKDAQIVLADSLRIYPPKPREEAAYVAFISTRSTEIESIEFIDSKNKVGAPVIIGLTAEIERGENAPGTYALDGGELTPEIKAFIESKPLRQVGKNEKESASKLDSLRNVLYTTEETFKKPVVPDIPAGYRGPRVRFKGDVFADICTGVFHHNVNDIDLKVSDDGMYHTSTKDAPSWGGYEGFGTWKDGWGAYYHHSWSRDLGRSLQEITHLGLLDKSKICADYCLRMTRAYVENPELHIDGQRLPAHVCRIMNLPNMNDGCYENDGHGLVALFIYKLWQRLPDRNKWLRERWTDIKALGDWVAWQLENPSISGSKNGVLRTDSECAGGVGYSVYADAVCMEALMALSDMADSIGEKNSSLKWRDVSETLKKGIESNYIDNDPKYGKIWTLRHSGWPNQSTVLGPIIFTADRRGFAPDDFLSDWIPINEAAYKRLINTYQPFGYYGVAMGYGQGFVAQSALLLDRMKEASEIVRWAAKCIYYPKHLPFVVPEGCEMHPSGKFWFRTGDLGNGVQQAEIVKMLRIIIGIDDNRPDRLRLIPRLPEGWSGISAADYPVLVDTRNGPELAVLKYTVEKTGKRMAIEAIADKPLPYTEIRFGPFSVFPKSYKVTVNGKKASASTAQTGDSWWIWTKIPAGNKRLKAVAQY